MRKGYIYTVVVLTILSFLFLFNSSVMASGRNCSHPSCNNKPVKGGVYCSVHTCKVDGCTSARVTEKGSYCYKHKCKMKNCEAGNDGSNYCSAHKKAGEAAEKKMWEKYQKSSSSGSSKKSYAGTSGTKNNSGTAKKKKNDPYNVYDYKSAQDFADDKYEEFYDYEDDYEDEDEAYDAAEDYWRDYYE